MQRMLRLSQKGKNALDMNESNKLVKIRKKNSKKSSSKLQSKKYKPCKRMKKSAKRDISMKDQGSISKIWINEIEQRQAELHKECK